MEDPFVNYHVRSEYGPIRLVGILTLIIIIDVYGAPILVLQN